MAPYDLVLPAEMSAPDVRFDRFYRHAELTDILEAWARWRPELCRLTSIGRSYEDRDIWLVTVTNFETGEDGTKPALWIDANIHATEVTGSVAALHLINKLLSEHGRDRRVTRVLDTRAFYIAPRLNPDGAEIALAKSPRFLRSSVRPYPRTDQQDGLHEEDVDGDGRILMMRVPDDNGAWKAHVDEPRLLVPREPDELPEEAQFYRLLPEGTIRNYDGVSIKIAEPLEGLDLNRNFPMDWAPEVEQQGAGPYPVSEPEVRALVQAVVDRPNITGAITYHTFSGVHLRPYSGYEDERFPTPDLRAYKLIGKEATKITGYPSVSVFHDFRYEPKEVIKGGFDDWMYEHLGVFAWTTEFWSPQRQAGISDYHLIEWWRDHPVDDDLKLLRWSDEKLGGRGYVDWYAFDHPQLGKVELGGWDAMHCLANPPRECLEDEIAPHADLALWHLSISPRLEIARLDVEQVDEGVFLVKAVLMNTGWLGTAITEKAVQRKSVRPIEVELTLPDAATLVGGEKKVEAGQLDGRVHKRSVLWWSHEDATTDRTKAEWVVHAPRGGLLRVEARHQRAGTAERSVRLG